MSTQSETVTVRPSPDVEREISIVAAIHRGLADIEAGRTGPHEEAMKRPRATVERRRHRS